MAGDHAKGISHLVWNNQGLHLSFLSPQGTFKVYQTPKCGLYCTKLWLCQAPPTPSKFQMKVHGARGNCRACSKPRTQDLRTVAEARMTQGRATETWGWNKKWAQWGLQQSSYETDVKGLLLRLCCVLSTSALRRGCLNTQAFAPLQCWPERGSCRKRASLLQGMLGS